MIKRQIERAEEPDLMESLNHANSQSSTQYVVSATGEFWLGWEVQFLNRTDGVGEQKPKAANQIQMALLIGLSNSGSLQLRQPNCQTWGSSTSSVLQNLAWYVELEVNSRRIRVITSMVTSGNKGPVIRFCTAQMLFLRGRSRTRKGHEIFTNLEQYVACFRHLFAWSFRRTVVHR